MVGSKRCYLCGDRFVRGQEIEVCGECGIRYHVACADERGVEDCPHCTGEGWIGVVEF